MLKRAIVAIAALSCMASPVLAQRQTAAQPSVVPAAEDAEGSELQGTGIFPYLAIAALILVILAATDTWPFDDDEPVSP